ncbi:MAG TPA: prepilin-type N-terminal cleavage/methylation domain-containing protein [Planctomycetota bacterium]|nr:prepilin-type N-terminal cleavage/methylation domain-containing protein [Planctomycetota bacterium]
MGAVRACEEISRERIAKGARRAAAPRGFTLVEVVTAIALLATAALVLAAALTTQLRANAVARERTVALAAAQGQLESLMAIERLTDLLALQDLSFSVSGLAAVAGQLRPGLVKLDVTNVPLVSLEVRVAWRGALGPDEVRLRTTVLVGALGL